MIDLLHQTEIWIDVAGNRFELATMDRHHRANLIPFLRGNAQTLQRAAAFRHWRSPVAAQHGGDAQFAMPAEDWLEQTPLMRRLVELEAGRPIEDRKLTDDRNRAYEAATGYVKVRHG